MIFLLVLLMALIVGLSFFIITNINSSEHDQKLAIKKLQDDVKRKSHELEDTQIHLKEFIEKHQQKENDRDAVNEQLKELHKLRDLLKQKESEIAKLTKTNQGLNNDLSVVKQDMDKLNTELISINEVYNGLKEQYAELEKDMESSSKEDFVESEVKPEFEQPPKQETKKESLKTSAKEEKDITVDNPKVETPDEKQSSENTPGKDNLDTFSEGDTIIAEKDKSLPESSKKEDDSAGQEGKDKSDINKNDLPKE
ncbi:MAG: hypothetical protein P9L96_06150 [Candidatus Gygaella obscura]|nr:hypothetical protein [Candidatus Gygaella obscura]